MKKGANNWTLSQISIKKKKDSQTHYATNL